MGALLFNNVYFASRITLILNCIKYKEEKHDLIRYSYMEYGIEIESTVSDSVDSVWLESRLSIKFLQYRVQ